MYTFWLILVSIIWGSTFFIIKDTVGSVNESFIVFARGFLAFVFMFIYQLNKKPKSLLNGKAFIYGSILGLLLGITYLSQTIGLKYTNTGHSAFITSSAIIFVPFMLYTLYKQKLFFIDIAAVVIVFFGLFLLTYTLDTPFNKGDIITIITAAACALHIVLAGRYVNKADSTTIITYQFFATTVFSLVAWLLGNDHSIHLTYQSGISLLYLGLVGTLVCYFISVWVQKYVSSLKVAIIFSLEPVFASFFGYLFLHERLNFKETMGALFILSGVLLHSLLKDKMERKYKAQKSFNNAELTE